MNAVAAAAANWGIGLDNRLLFHISEDLRRFRALTAGGTLVMGRKTLDSLPGGRPLPGRRCVILTRDPAFDRPGVETARSPEEALALTAGEDPDRVWLCGGGEVYALLLPFCRTCRLTRVFAAPPCDAFFPDLDRLEQWRAVRREAVRTEGGLSFQFIDFVNSAPRRPAGVRPSEPGGPEKRPAMPDLLTDVRYIKGIGEQRARSLNKLNIHTLRDLISYFPRSYDDRRSFRKIGELADGETACVEAMAAGAPTLSRVRKGMELVKVRVVDETGALELTFFNQPYRQNSIRAGETYTFFGKAEGAGRKKSMTNPVVEREGEREVTGRLMPVYPLTAGIGQLTLARAVAQGLAACRDLLPDPLPDEVRRAHHLCHTGYAYDQIHFPASEEELAIARRRLAFEELFLLAIGMKRLRRRRDALSCAPWPDTELADFYEKLPFALTGAQRRSIEEILADFSAGRPMNRLVQGDVGSGKTMVAAAAMVCAARNGKQSALMAPTEILAEQHYRGLSPLLEGLGVPCALLTGGMPAKARRETLARLASGEARAAIGTHALLSEGAAFHSLGLVVTDEQHRFGVAQRSALSAKGEHPHLLVMSATPIPRTLALIIYGDLDVSVIDQLPPGRQKIDTFAVPGSYRQRIYRFLEKEIAAGRQAYIICSMVGEGDAPPDDRKAVTEYAKTLQEQVFPALRVACVHGRMKPREKEAAMSAFAAGEVHILVSTTVVEVGVDVPNATVMVVEDADRFGLSQLHQLRGRVGRGAHKSFCILVSDNRSEEARARLKVMTATGDGFRIAEEDLRLRGPGDFFGQRQHGLPALKTADLSCDAALLREAQEAAEALLAADPALKDHPLTAQRVEELFAAGGDALN